MLFMSGSFFMTLGIILFLKTTPITGFSVSMSLFFFSMGFPMLYFVVATPTSFEIKGEQTVIGHLGGLIKRHYKFSDIESITPSPAGKFKPAPGLLINFSDRTQIHVHARVFNNYMDVEQTLTTRVRTDEKRRFRIPPIVQVFLVFLVMNFFALGLFIGRDRKDNPQNYKDLRKRSSITF